MEQDASLRPERILDLSERLSSVAGAKIGEIARVNRAAKMLSINALIVEQVKRLGCTAVSITHDLASARTIGDDIVLLHAGRIVWRGTPDELDHTDDARVRQFVDGRPDGPLTAPV